MADDGNTPFLISRQQAAVLGRKRYFSGKPCPHAHISERLVSNGCCIQCKRECKRRWQRNNPDKVAQRWKRHYARPGVAENKRLTDQCFFDRNPGYDSDRRKRNLQLARERGRATFARKQQTARGKLETSLRRRLYMAVKQGTKVGSAVRDLGCSIAAFKCWIEAQFKPGMTWENWGRDTWHIDHIKPLAGFDLSDQTQFLAACHYTNMRPMWATDNLRRPRKGLHTV